MWTVLRKSIVQKIANAAKKTKCPGCGHEFVPFSGQNVETFADLKNCQCPACGKNIAAGQLGVSNDYIGPIERRPRPADSRIECRPLGAQEWLYLIPRTGNSGGLMFFAVFWNLISWTVLFALVGKMAKESAFRWGPSFLILIFPLVGVGLLCAALRQKYARHILYLSRDRIKMERELFGWKQTKELAPGIGCQASLKSFYSKNYQPVYGIEISAASESIKFGSCS